ncbi:MAG: SprB repeat-containing protein, partial [Flavobacteriaceae bacterium]
MKKILYILLLVGWSAWSQTNTATSEYVLVVNGVILGGCCGTVGGLREVSLNLTNGGTIYKLRESDPSFIEESHWYFEHRFSLAGRVYSVKVRTKNGSNDGPWDERTVWINPQTCANTAIVGPFGKNETRFEVIVYPEILLADNQDYFSDVNQPFRISLSNQISISQINWQYTTTPHIAGSWQDLPAIYKSQTNLSIYGDEFLSWEDHGKEVYFRNDSGCETNYNRFISKYGATTPVNHSRYSNLISALYLKPAPKITSAIPSDLPCYDSASGSAKITFERALNPSEQISFSLRNTTLNLDYSEENITLSTADNSFMATGLLPGDYELELLGFDQGYNTYTEGAGYSATFSIEKPTAIDYSVNPTDAFCHGGSDGSFRIFAEGGAIQKSGLTYYEFRMEHLNPPTGNDLSKGWTSFTGLSAHSVTGLPAGQYKIWVRDTNGCVAKEVVRSPPDTGPIIGVGIEEHTETITIGQPSAPLAVTYTLLNEPSGHGLSDGSIRAHITGGTPFGNGSYSYTWRYENGVTLNGIGTTVPGNPGWFLTLNNAKAGKYYLTITDAKHATASNKEGCTLVNSEFVLTQPPPLAVNLQQTGLISCNTGNSVGDPTNNGQLTAAGSGGVPLDSFTNGTESYWYVWKKRVGQGTFQTIHGEQASVLSNIGPGTYSVNIVDKNGITIGTYVNNVLVNTTDTTITVIEPPLLELSLTKQDVFCYQGSDGSIQAIISGGTAPISLQWDHGPVTNSLNGLSEGNYSAIATDARGCSVRASIQITAPQEALEVVYTFRPPSFSGATDGRITALISGGTPRMDGSYIYHWRDPDLISMNPEVVSRILPEGFELVLDNVGAGTYLLTVEDGLHATAIQKTNCTIINSSFTLDEPDPLEVTVAMQNPISCNGANVYNDPAADGVLEAFALGGVPLQPSDNNGLPYYYTWKKEASPGVWTVLTAQTTHVASGLDAGNYAVNITDANGIIIGDYVDNVLSKAQNVEFVFNEPPLLEIALDKQDVFCHNGSDASAWVTITGGITPYTILWDNGGTTPQIDNLTEGTYEVTVIDARGCQAIASVEVGQPEYPLQVEHVAYAYPSTGGASDGWLRTQISGGTALEDGDYAYIWKDAHGNDLVGNTTTSIVDGKFEIYLQRLSKGSYFLVVEDANYTQAITKEGCTQILEAFVIEDPLEAVISVDVPISCSAGNPFDDPSSDGVLKVVVSGGVPFTTGQPYTYEWKKRASNGGLEDLGQDAPIAVGLSEGEYFFNVTDSKGRVIGTYDSDQLLAKTDVPFVFNGPEPIELTFSTTPISCSSGADGTAQVYIQGGVAPYEIEWSNGEEN